MNKRTLFAKALPLPALLLFSALLIFGCGSSDKSEPLPTDGDTDTETAQDGDSEAEAEAEADTEAEAESEEPVLPDKLAFDFSRPDTGDPISKETVTAFTKKLTATWKKFNYFKWISMLSNGVSDPEGKLDWAIWWGGDYKMIKTGNKVLYKFNTDPGGGGHNAWIGSSKILSSAIGAYLLTGDEEAGQVVLQYSKGLTAFMKCMEFGTNDPDKYIMARNFVPVKNQDFTLSENREKTVDYSGWFSVYDEWNTSRYESTTNPYWGNIWITNKRSKDDVCHIYRTTAFLAYAAEYAKDAKIKAAAAEAYAYMKGFAKDIYDHAYNIRTKGPDGKAVVLAGQFADLGSFTNFDVLFQSSSPNPECNAKVTTDILANGKVDKANAKCFNNGTWNGYEKSAANQHGYAVHIIRNFHMAAILHAMINRDNDVALRLMKGLDDRVKKDFDPAFKVNAKDDSGWPGEQAVFFLQAASLGFPLTSAEVAIVQSHYSTALDAMASFSFLNPWDASVIDGEYTSSVYMPSTGDSGVAVDELGIAFEYCNSPFRNPTGVAPVDCDLIKDPSKW